MTTTIQPTRAKTNATKGVPMDSLRKTALVAGVLYVITFVSIPTLVLYGPVLSDPNYIVGPGPDTAVIIGAILEVIVALAGVGTAVALYPVVKRQNEGVALGFVGSRTLEGAAIVAGVVSLLSLVTLRQAGAGANAAATGQALVAQYNWFFLLGQSLMPVLNALLLGSCCTGPVWCPGSFRCWHSSELPCFSSPMSRCCSAHGTGYPLRQDSSPSRSRSGSSRWAST